MADVPGRVSRRIGRPPAADSAETRRRILGVARKHFAELGYSRATTKDIATEAGLTTGGVYHYYASKRELYAAVAEEAWSDISENKKERVAAAGTFSEKLKASLDAAADLNEREPQLANFVASVHADVRWDPDLVPVAAKFMDNITQFYADLVAEAVQRGELSEEVRPDDVVNLLVAISEGISKLATRSSSDAHRRAVQVLELMLEGRLLDTPSHQRDHAAAR